MKRKAEAWSWLQLANPSQKKVLAAASGGWMLDAMDMMLYSMVLAELMRVFSLTPAQAGLFNSLTLVASAIGGVAFGILADRVGRVPALMGSILLYTLFTCLTALVRTPTELAVVRVGLGLGTGGEWAVGAALVAETWPARDRGKAMGLMQSAWAVGYALAAVVAGLLLPRFGWRAVFLFGAVPSLITIWIRRSVPESEVWLRSRESGKTAQAPETLTRVFGESRFRKDFAAVTAMNAAAMFGWWGLFTWVPTFLVRAGLGVVTTSSWIFFMQLGTWLGYVSFGFFADRFGRRKVYQCFVFAASVLVLFYARCRSPLALLLLGPFLGFFGTGHFSAIGPLTAELFPTPVRAAAQGLSYNLGRLVSAAAPFAIGAVSSRIGFEGAFGMVSVAFGCAALLAFFVRETLGTEL